MSDHGLISSYKGHNERRTGNICGFFKDAQGFGRLDAGSRAGFTSSRPPSPGTLAFQFPYFFTMCGLEKLGLGVQNWLKSNLSGLLVRTLVVGRRQKPETIEVVPDME